MLYILIAIAFINQGYATTESNDVAAQDLKAYCQSNVKKMTPLYVRDGWEEVRQDDKHVVFKHPGNPLTPVIRLYKTPETFRATDIFCLARVGSTVYNPADYANVTQHKATGKTVWDLVLYDALSRKTSEWSVSITEHEEAPTTRILVTVNSASPDICRVVMGWVLAQFRIQPQPHIKTFRSMNTSEPFVWME